MSSFEEMEEYAKVNCVPIIEKDGLNILLKYIKEHKPKTVLEIGTAIGYSSLKINEVCNSDIITFEREASLASIARANIKSFNKASKIKVIEEDFLDYELGDEKFDFIYIDGAKAQYYNFFKKVENNISTNTIVLFDNLNFHGYVYNAQKKEKASKNLKQLIRKIETFLEKIQKEEGYTFEYIKAGDGIGILKKDEKNE